ncbi:DnaJ homolog subfamily A member 5 [Fistulifera solaris]|uniref:DnaJ homolog subfamily A member 5 n=1 Tax=Fistulifera solaris TaxID=1519565 RepID=A0A1Z5JCZ1_FISSO|nr:DnaJ homolog subfamily A member 5 [Fistulifera solaris]|eukprot:GAX11865.1 DnaJ homolog subfamily A member 5 [Fistulifera solaris]
MTTETTIQCHYDVLGVEIQANAAAIKKAHRQLALQHHPDKGGDPEVFKRIQEAYECLSDPAERQWYDEHRSVILQGWSTTDGTNANDLIFQVAPFLHPSCFSGFDDETSNGFYAVYGQVFAAIAREEAAASSESHLPVEFGNQRSDWSVVMAFYQAWESFASQLSFAWADVYDTLSEPNRRIRRAMDDANKKARKSARKDRNAEVQALVHFVKKRDPRVAQRADAMRREKLQKEAAFKREKALRKEEQKAAAEEWRQEAADRIAQMVEEDRQAGRIRLADLEDDDYEYDVGKKKGKKKKRNKSMEQSREDGELQEEKDEHAENDIINDNNDLPNAEGDVDSHGDERSSHGEVSNEESSYVSSEEDEEEEPDLWRCECCRKDFKSAGQMENHMRSKKHKEAFKKYQAKTGE